MWVYAAGLITIPSNRRFAAWSRSTISPSWFDWKKATVAPSVRAAAVTASRMSASVSRP